MKILQICPPRLSDVPWEIQKSHFQHYYSYTSDYLCYLRRKQIATVVLQLLLFACCCLMPPVMPPVICVGGTLQEQRVCWCGRVEACGRSLLRHGLIFSTAWCTMRLISVEKDWKNVLTQKVVTMNICCECDTACLTFQVPHITTVFSDLLTFERTQQTCHLIAKLSRKQASYLSGKHTHFIKALIKLYTMSQNPTRVTYSNNFGKDGSISSILPLITLHDNNNGKKVNRQKKCDMTVCFQSTDE